MILDFNPAAFFLFLILEPNLPKPIWMSVQADYFSQGFRELIKPCSGSHTAVSKLPLMRNLFFLIANKLNNNNKKFLMYYGNSCRQSFLLSAQNWTFILVCALEICPISASVLSHWWFFC